MMLAIKYLIDERSKQRKAQAARAVSVAPSDVTGKHNMNKAKRPAILTGLRENDPHPTTELHFSSPFELLIAVLLSAQATDVSVNKATAKLYPVANTPAAMLAPGWMG